MLLQQETADANSKQLVLFEGALVVGLTQYEYELLCLTDYCFCCRCRLLPLLAAAPVVVAVGAVPLLLVLPLCAAVCCLLLLVFCLHASVCCCLLLSAVAAVAVFVFVAANAIVVCALPAGLVVAFTILLERAPCVFFTPPYNQHLLL